MQSTVNNRSFEAGVLETPRLSELRSGAETHDTNRRLLKVSEVVADLVHLAAVARVVLVAVVVLVVALVVIMIVILMIMIMVVRIMVMIVVAVRLVRFIEFRIW